MKFKLFMSKMSPAFFAIGITWFLIATATTNTPFIFISYFLFALGFYYF